MSVFDLLDPSKGFAVLTPKRPIIKDDEAYKIYSMLHRRKNTDVFFHNTQRMMHKQLIRDCIMRFKEFLREEVIRPLEKHEPLKFRGFTDLKTESIGYKPDVYHTDPWWIISTVAGTNSNSTWLLQGGRFVSSESNLKERRFPRKFDYFEITKDSTIIKPPPGSVVVISGNHRQNELRIPATVHGIPEYRKGTHRVLLHQTLYRRRVLA